MSRTPWRRLQRKKKFGRETVESGINISQSNLVTDKDKKQVGRQLISHMLTKTKGKEVKEEPHENDDMVLDNFDFRSKPDFGVIWNVMSVLPVEYDCPTEIAESEECDEREMAKHRKFVIML